MPAVGSSSSGLLGLPVCLAIESQSSADGPQHAACFEAETFKQQSAARAGRQLPSRHQCRCLRWAAAYQDCLFLGGPVCLARGLQTSADGPQHAACLRLKPEVTNNLQEEAGGGRERESRQERAGERGERREKAEEAGASTAHAGTQLPSRLCQAHEAKRLTDHRPLHSSCWRKAANWQLLASSATLALTQVLARHRVTAACQPSTGLSAGQSQLHRNKHVQRTFMEPAMRWSAAPPAPWLQLPCGMQCRRRWPGAPSRRLHCETCACSSLSAAVERMVHGKRLTSKACRLAGLDC